MAPADDTEAQGEAPSLERNRNSWPRLRRRRLPRQRETEHIAVAMVDGGVLYEPCPEARDAQVMGLQERSVRSRSRSGTRRGRSSSPMSSSSEDDDVILTSNAWPTTPPPAQPDMLPRPVVDEHGPVGVAQAYPLAKAADVVGDLIAIIKPYDLVQVLPMSAFHWRDVERVLLPPQLPVRAHEPIDLRTTRWEMFQDLRHVPVMADGKITNTLVLPWHMSLDEARRRIDHRAPRGQHWLLTAASHSNWVLHRLALPEYIEERLLEWRSMRQELRERGGMKPPMSRLQVHLMHSGVEQSWKVDADMTIDYFLGALASEFETSVKNILVMRGMHVPGVHETIASYLPVVKVFLIDRMATSGNLPMTIDSLRAAVIWQRAKIGDDPWQDIQMPYPTGPPQTYGPRYDGEQSREFPMCACLIKVAHAPEEKYTVHAGVRSTVEDLLHMLEHTTPYRRENMMLVKGGKVLASYMNITCALPVSYLVCGHRMDAVDVCVPNSPAPSNSLSLSLSTSIASSPRGGARTARTAQQPRSAMLLWAEDKITREVQGLNMLTVRMLLRAEQRTVSAVLHSRSAIQTREILVAAYRRAGLNIDQGRNGDAQDDSLRTLDDMRQALLNQTTITSQIATRLEALPTNADFVELLQSVSNHTELQRTLLEQNAMIMTYLRATHEGEESRRSPVQGPGGEPSAAEVPSTQDHASVSVGATQEDLVDQDVPTSPLDAHRESPVRVARLTDPNAPTPPLPESPVSAQSEQRSRARPVEILPSPKRRPVSYGPGGVGRVIQAFEDASSRNAAARPAVGTARNPFRAGR